jgi:LysM repeat protein
VSDNKKKYTSPPTPIRLEAPELPEDCELPKRGRTALPEVDIPIGMPRGKSQAPSEEKGLGVFRAAQRSYAPTKKNKVSAPEFGKRLKSRIPRPRPRPRGKENPFLRQLKRIRINTAYLSFAGWGIAAIILLYSTVWFISGLFVDNAFAVYLDDELIGYVAINDELTSEDFHRRAIQNLEAVNGGVKVQVEQRVTIEPARASGSERASTNDIFGIIGRKIEFTIAAHAIYVNGEFEALLRTSLDLEHVKDLLTARFRNEHTTGFEFVDGWEVKIRYVCPKETEFCTPEQAYWRLDRTTLQVMPYTVVSGDNLGRIAVRFGTTVSRIMGDNSLTGHNIFTGDVLSISTHLPLIGVRTFDEYPTMELIETPVQEIDNPDLPLAETRIIQEGQPGQQVSVVRVTYVNGIERSREQLPPETVIEPVPMIIERGTGAGEIERR